MPNYITNRVIINGAPDKVNKVIDFVKSTSSKGEEIAFDFNKITPLPESLQVEQSSVGEDGQKYLLAMAGNIMEPRNS